MIGGALIVAGAIFIHAAWTTSSNHDEDITVATVAGLLFIIVGLVDGWIF
jgi:hypothetical protein